MSIKIPDDYDDINPGMQTLKLGVPWVARGAIYWLENKTFDRVLEFGSGGSTIFFAERSISVLSFEDNIKWLESVYKELQHRKLFNVTIEWFDNDLFEKINMLENDAYDCVIIDIPNMQYKREIVYNCIKDKLTIGATIILDNYAHKRGFPTSYKMSIQEFIDKFLTPNYKGVEFRQKGWVGKGTRIFYV